MSDEENEDSVGKPFCIERAKQGRAKCKKCKQNIAAGALRIAKLITNPFGEGLMKQWYHESCMFEQFLNQRATTKRIENSYDIDGWEKLEEDDKNEILKKIDETETKLADKLGTKYSPKKQKPKAEKGKTDKKIKEKSPNVSPGKSSDTNNVSFDKFHKDNLFREFRRLVADVTNENSYLEKTAKIKKLFTEGSDGKGFKGNLIQWCKLLLPSVEKRVYNLQSKQLVKLFSNIFETDRDEMLEHLEQGDIGETIQQFFENSNTVKPTKKSLLTIHEVDEFLEELKDKTKEDEQIAHFKSILKKCTGNDLKIIIRLIKHDLRMNAGAKHVLEAVHPAAYEAYQACRDLSSVIKKSSSDSHVKASIKIMTPVLPMLAEACKSVEQAMKKCPNGMYSEIKYDGERVQVHKHGSEFKYFSRSLKPVMPHKVNHFKDYIPQAFPHANDLILDSEVLLIDTTGKPLPFGSLGVHKKEEFKDANVCLFVFDCIYYNGKSLVHKSIKERRKILQENMTEIPNHIVFSETEEVHNAKDLAKMIAKVLNLGLEGLVLKDLKSIYEPGKRHWLKVKKDYLLDGAMADAADLVVLGAWYGTGKKGGMMSIFLMGCYDKLSQKFCTVTKVHTGHDDKTLEDLQTELDMIKISCEPSKVPSWLKCTKTMIPDFVARDPKKQPVWEITGAEFTKHDVHTADGISIRFPRVTKIRNDKDWESATSLQELQDLFQNSKDNTDYSALLKTEVDDDIEVKEKDKSTKHKRIHQKRRSKSSESDEEEIKPKQKRLDDFLKNYDKNENNSDEDKPSCSTAEIKKETHKRTKDKQNKSSTSKKIKLEKLRFPDIFENVNILPLKNVRETNEEIFRYFVAYGGNLLQEDELNSATHIVHPSNITNKKLKNVPTTCRHVTIDWLKDSIAHKKIQDIKPYTVKLNSE